MSEVWEGRCTPGRREKKVSWTRHRAPRLTHTAPDPPGCSIDGHSWAAGNICEITEILIALFIAVALSVGMWWVIHIAAESQTLVSWGGEGTLLLHKHHLCSVPPLGTSSNLLWEGFDGLWASLCPSQRARSGAQLMGKAIPTPPSHQSPPGPLGAVSGDAPAGITSISILDNLSPCSKNSFAGSVGARERHGWVRCQLGIHPLHGESLRDLQSRWHGRHGRRRQPQHLPISIRT